MGIRGEIFSTTVNLENRTYFFNVKENRLGDLYLNIVESKNKDSGGFDRQSVILFAEDLQEFLKGFDESLKVMEKAVREQRRGSGAPRPRRDDGEERPHRGDREGYGDSSRPRHPRRDEPGDRGRPRYSRRSDSGEAPRTRGSWYEGASPGGRKPSGERGGRKTGDSRPGEKRGGKKLVVRTGPRGKPGDR